MGSTTATFKQPFLDNVKQALDGAVSICWEGCHKIYINRDQDAHEEMIGFGYDCIPVEDQEEALDQLFNWFEASCSLRFINSITGRGRKNSVFGNEIGQFEYDAAD